MLNINSVDKISYQVKKLKFYDDPTTNVTFVGKKTEIYNK